jgi:sulfoxide reductase heme-binding subunit YedZ
MLEFSYLDISGSMGLVASGALTFNVILGMFLSTNFKTTTYWKKLPPIVKKYPIIKYHNFTAYIAFCSIVLHLIFLFLYKEPGFSIDILLTPLAVPKQPNIVLLGVIGFYGLIIVLISSQKIIRKKLGFNTWKRIHLISYLTSLAFLIHGLLMDPLLKDRPTDWLDAEKFFSEGLVIVFLVAVFIRIRIHFNQKKNSLKPSSIVKRV